jgi:hypothetical protein
MKPKRFILKFFAIILLLAFSQKITGEFYIHNWLHSGRQKQATPQSSEKNFVSYSCTCVADFSMPFAEPVFEIASFVTSSHQIFFPPDIYDNSLSFLYFNSLRAPPTTVWWISRLSKSSN